MALSNNCHGKCCQQFTHNLYTVYSPHTHKKNFYKQKIAAGKFQDGQWNNNNWS